MRCFADEQRPMTIAQASRATGLSRPSVKRCLHTLVKLGYASQSGVTYTLRPKVLALGYAYLSSSTLAMRAQPYLDQVRDDLHESCSLGVIEDDEVYYVARAEVSRIMSIALRAGSRLPLYCTSMGRVLLSGWSPAERGEYFRHADLRALTQQTRTSPSELNAICEGVQREGFAVVDQELEVGLRSIAVPVFQHGEIIASLNVGTQASRITLTELRTRFLPVLRRAAEGIRQAVAG